MKENFSKFLKEGKISVMPTDTLYGICTSAFSKKSVRKIYQIKGRDDHKPFIILISSILDLKKFGIKLTKDQKSFLDNVWPNSVSVILPVPQKRFEYLHRGTKSLAFRLPKKKSLELFIKKTGPLVAPSANPQGLTPATTITEAKEYFGEKIDLYVSDGKIKGKPSIIVSLLENKLKISE